MQIFTALVGLGLILISRQAVAFGLSDLSARRSLSAIR